MPDSSRTISGQTVVRYGPRPAGYFVAYEDRAARRQAAAAHAGGDTDLVGDDSCMRYRDAETYAEAQLIASELGTAAARALVFERSDLRDLTPASDPSPSRVWEFVEQEVVEPQAGSRPPTARG